MMLEADRFQNLKVPIDLFKTETRAVLGEYNKNASSPVRKLSRSLRETAFKSHTYQHTTMGFLRDVENMPNMYEYSLEFFKRYYRPEYVTIIVAGDVKHDAVLQMVNKYWAGWKRGTTHRRSRTRLNRPQPLTGTVDWPTPTLPWVAVAFKGPPTRTNRRIKPRWI